MFIINKFLTFLKRIWDPRPILAREWLKSAEKYEELLRANKSLNLQVVEAILQERNRIQALFNTVLPEFKGQTSVVVTRDAQVEHCGVFLWKNHLYVLVSGALLGRPFDHPQNSGVKAWEWLARHEAAHIRNNHLPWLFYTRRLFRFAYYFCGIFAIFLSLTSSAASWEPLLWLLLGLWGIQTVVALCLEWKADLVATQSINDPLVLKEAEEALCRMNLQNIERLPFPLGWIQYVISMVFIDPHPPLIARRWLLRRSLQNLKDS